MMQYNWWSLKWLNPVQLFSHDWQFPWMLSLLVLLPIVYLFYQRTQQIPSLATGFNLSKIETDPKVLLRHIPTLLFGGALFFLILALAKPGERSEHTETFGEGIDIVLLMDVSGSMNAEDFKPNRLEVAKEVAVRFVEGREHDKIGTVIFAEEAIPFVPLTSDHELVKDFVRGINFGLIPQNGTAIGEALGKGVVMLEKSEAKSKVFILLSDGENTAKADPITMAKLAYTHGIKMYTIGVGVEGEYTYRDDFGFERTVRSHLDETTLREIAKIGKGKFFRAQDSKGLLSIFKEINLLEKSKVETATTYGFRDRFHPYVFYSLCCLILWLLAKSSFMSNALED